MPQKPVIFLAFANDRVDHTAYLRNLPIELDGIRSALQKAVKAGLCEVVERSNATIQHILDVFQDEYYKDRIAIFHYGGHANGYQLLLENLDGSHASAHADGLVSFFSKQQGLQLIFLNGCSSQQQALDLIGAGVAAVIGTSQSINDDVATQLAIRFYKGMAAGKAIDRSWQEAIDEVKITKGTANMRDLFWDGMEESTFSSSPAVETQNLASPQPLSHLDRFPWEIHYKEGA
ncbi:MAG: CHAT domain-containing protein, partial [Flammeovirgaceae bacterium]